ncbi:FAD-binding oxidoreductase [uncultured Roseovarius sp.]|uniref:NAD(P)/FAD-dependent oxidoreductase n=1 Tax=uncultured Roseovarius sp. TaxID=293344 RepID=UPI00260B0A80|nr:FAD-dependent oxidoreductase [uncultured Roseovarius sp.]
MIRERVIVVGAGVIGASVAYRVAQQGAKVTVIDAGQPACGASGHSFGWINASFFADETHHHLRVAGIEAYHRLLADLPGLSVTWPGCLWWEEQGEGLARMEAQLRDLGYPVERIGGKDFAAAAPAIGQAPDEALVFPGEGVGAAERMAAQLLDGAREAGATVILGCRAERIEVQAGKVTGLRCTHGMLPADRVLVAAGNGCADLMTAVDVPLPMLQRPGALVRTRPLPPLLKKVMVSPELEFRQDALGRIIAPSSAAHQADDREVLPDTPDGLALDTLRRLRALLPGVDLVLDQTAVAMRPVPGDGLPAVGHCGPEGLYLAVMHSGVTLAALMGELIAQELLDGAKSHLLTPYRPGRFAFP